MRVNFFNGQLAVRSQKWHPYDGSPPNGRLPVFWNRCLGNSAPHWDEFIEAMIPYNNDRRVLQKYLGSCLVHPSVGEASHGKVLELRSADPAGSQLIADTMGCILGCGRESDLMACIPANEVVFNSVRKRMWGKYLVHLTDTDAAEYPHWASQLLYLVSGADSAIRVKALLTAPSFHPRLDELLGERLIVIDMLPMSHGNRIPSLAAELLPERLGIIEWLLGGLFYLVAGGGL